MSQGMKLALSSQPPAKKEITVKTAAGEEFKFEGINPKFTRKLVEWESRRGIAPESSTITLLQAGLAGGARPPGAAGTPCRALEPRQGQLVETTVGGGRVLGGAAGGLRRGGRLGVAAAPRPLGGRRGTGN